MKRLKYWGRDSLIKELNDNLLNHYSARELAKICGVTTRTIRKLQLPVSKGGTRYVKSLTVRKILKPFRGDLKIVFEDDTL